MGPIPYKDNQVAKKESSFLDVPERYSLPQSAIGRTDNAVISEVVMKVNTVSIANATWTKVPLDEILSDPFFIFNQPQSNFIIKEDGLYVIACSSVFTGANLGARLTGIYLNPSAPGVGTELCRNTCPGLAADLLNSQSVTIRPLKAGDTLEMHVFQDSGGALNLYGDFGSGLYLTWVTIVQIPNVNQLKKEITEMRKTLNRLLVSQKPIVKIQ